MLDIALLIQQCVNPIAKNQMLAIVQTESSRNPLAIGLNKGFKLKYQPTTEAQAKKWLEYLEKNQYNYDVGLAQINIKNIKKYGYTPSDMLDACTNLKVGSDILAGNYKNALSSSRSEDEAWQKAISAYNTGNFTSGFANGYVAKVNASAKQLAVNTNQEIPPIVELGRHPHTAKEPIKVKLAVNNDQSEAGKPARNSSEGNPYKSKTVMYVQPKMGNRNDLYAQNN